MSEVYQNQLVFSTFDPVEGRKGELTRIDMRPEDAFFWDLSPDGSRIAFGKMDTLSGRISILQLGSGTTQEISVRGWTNLSSLAWSVDGKSWFVIRMSTTGSSLLRVAFNGEARLLREVTGWLVRPLPSPDGRYLAFGEVSLNSNAWMIENLAME